MSLFEGGPFKCVIDGFTTTDVDEWNKHCSKKEGDSTHVSEAGAAPCASCGDELDITGFPFMPYDDMGRKTIIVLCEDCTAKTRGATIRKAKKGADSKK